MELLRWAQNPWSEQILVGLGWAWIWLALAAGALFILGHALYVRRLRSKSPGAAGGAPSPNGKPASIVRHTLAARISHWLMAVTVLTLLITGFVPILGLHFPWVTIHWIAGVLLAAYLVYHIAQTAPPRTFRRMWIGRGDLQDARLRVQRFFGRSAPTPRKPGKWPLENKVFHHLTALMGIAVIGTGLLMMLRVDTPFWDPNPYVLTDATWGIIFVLHGLAAVAFIGMLMLHIYFAVRPEKRWLTWSMLLGKITRRNYEAHHDPARWPVTKEEPAEEAPAPVRARAHATTNPE